MGFDSTGVQVEVVGTPVRQTEKAYLIDVEGLGEVWVPKSQMRDKEWLDKKARKMSFYIPEWLARDKGIME